MNSREISRVYSVRPKVYLYLLLEMCCENVSHIHLSHTVVWSVDVVDCLVSSTRSEPVGKIPFLYQSYIYVSG